jgi:UDP-hydrolysing UDP-N-acetyl-D-glucosamine 2-epimerase
VNPHPSLLVVTGTRADFGLWLPVIAAADHAGLPVRLLVMGMHLDPRYGDTIAEVEQSGVPVAGRVRCTAAGDSLGEMSTALARALEGATPIIEAEKPDHLLVLGDRGEQLAAALAAMYLGTSVVHLHGGERTRGAVDDTVRDLISRVARLHMVATPDARDTLLAMGIEPGTVEITGAPGLDAIAARDPSGDQEVRDTYGVSGGRYLLLVHHPETVGDVTPERDVAAVTDAIRDVGMPTVAILPNSDAGGRTIARHIESIRHQFAAVRASVPHDEFLGLLTGAAALVGNSSSGIIEAPLLGVPVVNVGHRQDGRTRGDNVIDAPADSEAIAAAIRRAIEPAFQRALSGRSPYGDGRAASRIIARILQEHAARG